MAESIAKLRWSCRRGMLELDVLLQHFLEHAYSGLDDKNKECFEKILTYPDPNLFSWLLGTETAPAEIAPMIEAIKQCKIKPLS